MKDSIGLSELNEARKFTKKRIKEAERQQALIGHNNAHNEEYRARDRDIAGFRKTIAEIDDKIRKLQA